MFPQIPGHCGDTEAREPDTECHSLKGLDYIDVLSSSKKDYKLNFFSYKEGHTAKVSTH